MSSSAVRGSWFLAVAGSSVSLALAQRITMHFLVHMCAPLVVASTLNAQSTAPGFVSTTLTSPGSGFTLSATLADGSYLVLTVDDLTLRAPGGSLIRTLHTFGSFIQAFPSFLLVDPSEAFAVYGLEPLTYPLEGVWRVDLAGGPPMQIQSGGVVGSSGAAFETPSTIVVSTSSYEANESSVRRLDLVTRAYSLLVEDFLDAGPLALDPDGDLLLASAEFFPPPWEIRRFTASQIVGAPALPIAAGALEHTGSASTVQGLARDPLGFALFVAESEENSGEGVDQVRALDEPRLPVILATLPANEKFLLKHALQFLPGDRRAAFLPFQPASGGTLIYVSEVDFGGLERRSLTPARPLVAVSGPGTIGPGQFDVSVSGGPPGGMGIVAFGPSSSFSPDELVLNLGVPIFIGLDLPTLQIAPGRILLDASGSGAIGYVNPSGVVGQYAIQVMLFDAQGRIAGTSGAAFL
jgi:hypothetical protein